MCTHAYARDCQHLAGRLIGHTDTLTSASPSHFEEQKQCDDEQQQQQEGELQRHRDQEQAGRQQHHPHEHHPQLHEKHEHEQEEQQQRRLESAYRMTARLWEQTFGVPFDRAGGMRRKAFLPLPATPPSFDSFVSAPQKHPGVGLGMKGTASRAAGLEGGEQSNEPASVCMKGIGTEVGMAGGREAARVAGEGAAVGAADKAGGENLSLSDVKQQQLQEKGNSPPAAAAAAAGELPHSLPHSLTTQLLRLMQSGVLAEVNAGYGIHPRRTMEVRERGAVVVPD